MLPATTSRDFVPTLTVRHINIPNVYSNDGMRGPPKDVIASWPTPNYKNPETRGHIQLIVECTLMPIVVMTLVTRLYVRVIKLRSAQLDDWLMLAAMICGFGVTVCSLLATQKCGWGIHIWDLTREQIVRGRQVSIAAQTCFLFTSGLTKTSILFSYLRFAPRDSWFRMLVWNMIGLLILLMAVFVIALWTQCMPPHAYWNEVPSPGDESPSPYCKPEGPPVLSQAIINAITDFLVCVLPINTLWTLHLPTRKRMGLILLFFLGFFVTFAGGWRAWWAHHVTDETWDVTWEGVEMWIWTAVEADLGIICGCIPALCPIFRGSSKTASSRYARQKETLRDFSNNMSSWTKQWKKRPRDSAEQKTKYPRMDSIVSNDGDLKAEVHRGKDIEMGRLSTSGLDTITP